MEPESGCADAEPCTVFLPEAPPLLALALLLLLPRRLDHEPVSILGNRIPLTPELEPEPGPEVEAPELRTSELVLRLLLALLV